MSSLNEEAHTTDGIDDDNGYDDYDDWVDDGGEGRNEMKRGNMLLSGRVGNCNLVFCIKGPEF